MTFDPCIDNVCLKCDEQFDQIRLSCGSHTICCSAYRLAVLISRNNCIQCTYISCMVRLVINQCTIQNLFQQLNSVTTQCVLLCYPMTLPNCLINTIFKLDKALTEILSLLSSWENICQHCVISQHYGILEYIIILYYGSTIVLNFVSIFS